jgi:hypothetical protein
MAGKKVQQPREKEAFREALNRYITRKRANPFYLMVRMVADDEAPLPLRLAAAIQLAQYLQPKLRSVVLTGDADSPLEILHRYGSGESH